MAFFISLAVKSLLASGATLLSLKLMQKRSSSDRSWIAHLGLAALLLLPVATMALPKIEVAGPDFLVADVIPGPAAVVRAAPIVAPAVTTSTAAPEVATPAASFPVADAATPGASIDWALWAYLVPAALLVLLTLIAFGRLVTLKARADVLIDQGLSGRLAGTQAHRHDRPERRRDRICRRAFGARAGCGAGSSRTARDLD